MSPATSDTASRDAASSAHADMAQDARHDHHADASGHGSMRDYVIGFVLSVILTALAFWLVMGKVLGSSNMTALAIMALAAVQIVVHMIYFLHMNTKSDGGWTMLAFIFTIVVVVITLSGSLWVMYHLNSNMMPAQHRHERPMP